MSRVSGICVRLSVLISLFVLQGFADSRAAAAIHGDVSPECGPVANAILVTVENIRSDKGKIVVELHDNDPDNFLKRDGRLLREWIPAQKGSVSLCITAPDFGTYAIAVYHDKNDNLKFDKTWIGLPSEPYGLSRNPKFALRKPRLEEAAITVPEEGTALVIELKH